MPQSTRPGAFATLEKNAPQLRSSNVAGATKADMAPLLALERQQWTMDAFIRRQTEDEPSSSKAIFGANGN
jgi:hypothetical protein